MDPEKETQAILTTPDWDAPTVGADEAAPDTPGDGEPEEKHYEEGEEPWRISSIGKLFLMTCFGFPVSMIMFGIAVILPMFIGELSDTPAFFLGAIGLVSGALQLIGLVISYFSDRCTSRFGRRRPFILVGSVLIAAGCILLIIGIQSKSLWPFVIGYWGMTFALSFSGQANSALASDLTAKSRLGMVGGTSGLWVAVGGVCGLLLVGFVDLIYVCAVFCGTIVLATIVVIYVAKEVPLPKDAEILLPLRRAKTPGQKVWFGIKDFVTSFLFSIKRFPDFFLLLLQRAVTALSMIPQNYLQYFLNDILCVPDPQTYASLMMMIILIITLFASPVFGVIADKYKRPRLLMVAGTFVTMASMSVFIWGNSIYFFLFLQTALSGICSAAIAASSMPVSLSVMPSRKKAAQFFAEFTLFEFVSIRTMTPACYVIIFVVCLCAFLACSFSCAGPFRLCLEIKDLAFCWKPLIF